MKKGTTFQHKKPDEAQVCAICGFPLKTFNALGKHVAKYHSNQCTMKEYVDKYVEPYAHKCPYCDNERNFSHGRYKETCADKACIQKHREATNMVKYGHKCSLKGTNEQKVVEAIVEKYGVDNVFKLDSMQQLAKQRIKDKYGKEYVSQVPEIRKKIEQVCIDKFGYKTNLLNPEHIKRIKNTCLEKYGNEYVCASEYTQNKNKQHCLEKFGVEYYMQTDEFRQKSKQTCLMCYGVDNVMKSASVQEKFQNTLFRNYGVIHPSYSPVLRERSRHTMLKHYGYEYYAQIPGAITPYKYKKDSDGYFSKAEHTFADMLTVAGIQFRYNYTYQRKTWDFAVFNNGLLDTVIEIDGEFHHGYQSDWKCLKIDCGRFAMLKNTNVKLICGDSCKLNEIYDLLQFVLRLSFDDWMKYQYDITPKEFPYPRYNEHRIHYDYAQLCKLYNNKNTYKNAQYGMSSVYMYNTSMYTQPRINHVSLVDMWHNDDLRQKCVYEQSLYNSPCSSAQPIMGLLVSSVIPMPRIISTGMYLFIIKNFLQHVEYIIEYAPINAALLLAVNACGRTYLSYQCDSIVLAENKNISRIHELPSITEVTNAQLDAMSSTCVICDLTLHSVDVEDIMTECHADKYVFITDNKALALQYTSIYDSFRFNYGALVDEKYMFVINCK